MVECKADVIESSLFFYTILHFLLSSLMLDKKKMDVDVLFLNLFSSFVWGLLSSIIVSIQKIMSLLIKT